MSSLFLRITLILLLAVAVWNPSISLGDGPVDLFVLLDDSYSMRGKLDQALWSQIRVSLRKLPKQSRMALIRYGKHPVLEMPLIPIDDPQFSRVLESELPPSHVALDRSATNLEQALTFAARLINPQRATNLLIIHDNQQTSGNASSIIQTLKQQGNRFFRIDLASRQTEPDAWIQSLKAPLFADANQNFPVSASVGGNRDLNVAINVYLNDRLLRRQLLHVVPGILTPFQVELAGCPSGASCIVKMELQAEGDAILQNNQRKVAITVNKISSILSIRHKKYPSPIVTTLSASGVMLNSIHPDLCIDSVDRLKPYTVIILDDISVEMMPENCWNALSQAVQNLGIGLIVLGGPNSFAAGSYRHSVFEDLLPVTAEASKQYQATSILFLIDKSGSMDSEVSGPSRMSIARQAVIDSMVAQRQRDEFGLISFDVEPYLHIPIMYYVDPVAKIKEAFNVQAKGGTRLKPALDFALQELGDLQNKNRILILITDGFLDEQDLISVERKIIEEHISVITLAIGKEVESEKLRRLTQHNKGKLLRIDHITELPLFLRKEIDQRRSPVITGRISVNQQIPLSFMDKVNIWPNISAYMVTKAKPDSVVFLAATNGDPLLAMRYAGVGKIIALPAGLGDWAENWWHWTEWRRLITGLIQWCSISSQHPQMNIELIKSADETQLGMDVITTEQAWQTTGSGLISISHPNGIIQSQPLIMKAPGRYISNLPINNEGLYSISARIGDLNTSLNIFNDAIDEFIPSEAQIMNESALSTLIPDNETMDDIRNPQMVHVRSLLLTCALAVYMLLIFIANKFTYTIVFALILTFYLR